MITVLGSINLDMIATGERLPSPGETVPADQFATAPGGKGANQALAAARAGAKVKMVGAVGSDEFVNLALSQLKGANVDLSAVRTVPGPTGIAIILVDKNGENVIVIIAGANGAVDAEMARAAVAQMSRGDYLVMPQEIPASAIKTALQAARQKGVISLLNIAPVIAETAQLAQLADIIVANETEYALLVDEDVKMPDIGDHAANWAKQHNKTLIITLGGDGVIAVTPAQRFDVKALDITPIDTVGAGDTFCGYLAAGLDQGLNLKLALERAAIAGSLACLKPGAQPAIPDIHEVLSAQNS